MAVHALGAGARLSSRLQALAAEPAGLPTHVQRHERTPQMLRGTAARASAHARRARTVGICLVLQLAAVAAIYFVHERWVVPRLTAPHIAEAHKLLQSSQPALRQAAVEVAQAGVLPTSGAAGAGGCPAGCFPAAAANCTVRLHEADRQMLEREMDAVAKALADPQPWPGGASDAATAMEVGDGVSKGSTLAVVGRAVSRPADQVRGPHNSANVPGKRR